MQDTEVMEQVGSTNVAAFERPAEAVQLDAESDEGGQLGWSGDYGVSVIPMTSMSPHCAIFWTRG